MINHDAVYWTTRSGWKLRHTTIESFKKNDDDTVSIRSVSDHNYKLVGEDAESFIEQMSL